LTLSPFFPTFSDTRENREIEASRHWFAPHREGRQRLRPDLSAREKGEAHAKARRQGADLPIPHLLRSFATEAAARKEAKRIATLIANGDTVAASMRGADAASFARAAELLKPSGLSLEGAAATVARAVEILGGDRLIEAAQFYTRHRADQITPRTVAEVLAELLASRRAQGKSVRYWAIFAPGWAGSRNRSPSRSALSPPGTFNDGSTR
jgi:hypothetical protein